MKKSLALVGLLAIAGLGLGVLSGCNKDDTIDPDPTIVDDDGPQESDHNWVEDSRTDATCTKEGSVTYKCSICGETKTEVVPALGHEWGEADYVAASEEPVVEAHWVRSCERCGVEETFTTDELPNDAVLSVTEESQLTDLTSINGVTIALSGTYDEVTESETPFEFSSALSITGSDVTLVIGEGSSVSTATSTEITDSALISVAEGASLTLELGEEAELSGAAGQWVYNTERRGLIHVNDGGELVINGGEGSTITQTYKKAPVLTVSPNGKCTVNGGDFTVTDATYYVVVNDGELTINGGVFSTENDGSSLIISGDNYVSDHKEDEAPVLNITGGVFQGGKHVIKNALQGVATISGGQFDGYKKDENITTDLIDTEGAVTYITGGTFGQDASNAGDGIELGTYANVLAIKSGTSEFASTVTITGGEFYKGTSSWFTFGDSTKAIDATEYDSVVIADSVWEVLGTEIVAENTEGSLYTISEENGSHVVISASVSSGSGNPD